MRVNEMGGHMACFGEKRNAYRVLMSKCEGRRPLRRYGWGSRWEDIIKVDL